MEKLELTKVQIAYAARIAYEARRDRREHPEGTLDNARRWYPSERENADGDGTSTRSPSRAWPWSYAHRCRTRQHVRVLVERAITGADVPLDIANAVSAACDFVPSKKLPRPWNKLDAMVVA